MKFFEELDLNVLFYGSVGGDLKTENWDYNCGKKYWSEINILN